MLAEAVEVAQRARRVQAARAARAEAVQVTALYLLVPALQIVVVGAAEITRMPILGAAAVQELSLFLQL